MFICQINNKPKSSISLSIFYQQYHSFTFKRRLNYIYIEQTGEKNQNIIKAVAKA